MHIKHIHETIEKLSQYACEEACKSKEAIDTKELGEVVDMVKDLAEAEYYSRIAKAMEEADEEEKEEIKYIMKKMKEEGEDWGEEEARRFYRGQPRSRTSGRYMSRGDGRRSRGYEEPMYYGMMPEIHNPMEYYRDMDRMDGKMYFSETSASRNSSNYADSTNRTGNMSMRDGREGRSGISRRSYMETKEMHKGNTPEDKQMKMKELESYMKELSEDVTEMISDATPEEKSLLKQKMQVLMQKI